MSSNRIVVVGSLVVVAISALAFMMFSNSTTTNAMLLSLKQYIHVSRDGITGTKVPGHNRDDAGFTLTCPEMTESGGLLPFTNTCLPADGGVSPALQWSGAPADTKQFMLAMWSRADTAVCNRYEWVLYNIPATTTSIAAGNPDNIGTFGGSFPGVPKYEYASPCPDGTGYKTYYFTLYALNDDLGAFVDSVNDDYYKRVGPELLLEVPPQSLSTTLPYFYLNCC